MSAAAKLKLSPALKQLIALPSAKGAALPAPPPAAFKQVFDNIRHKGERGGVGRETWLTLGTAALFTVNSPDAVCQLFNYASEGNDTKGKVDVASVMRETGLKCISFNGIPRSINNLNALHSHLPEEVLQNINEEPQRVPDSIPKLYERGLALWDGIYEPHSKKLIAKLTASHPDLAVHILNSHYGPLLSDPAPQPGIYQLGRVLTSVVAIAALRAQTGVGPQVTSHVYGLKKSILEGGGGNGDVLQGQEWLTSDDGVSWVIESVDDVAKAVRG